MCACPCQYKQPTCSASGGGCYGSGAYQSNFGASYSSVANSSKHKSFDLSDVAINGSGTEGSYRQFHQTRIYIQNFKNMISHGSNAGEGTYLITANLPEQVQYGIGSKWEAPLGSFNNATWNGIMQMVSNSGFWEKWGLNGENFASGINRVTTVKIWGGTDPFRISISNISITKSIISKYLLIVITSNYSPIITKTNTINISIINTYRLTLNNKRNK